MGGNASGSEPEALSAEAAKTSTEAEADVAEEVMAVWNGLPFVHGRLPREEAASFGGSHEPTFVYTPPLYHNKHSNTTPTPTNSWTM